MPQKRLQSDDVDFIMKMKKVKYSNCEIARKLGVTEGAIRYRLKRSALAVADKRSQKPSALNNYDAIIRSWIEDYADEKKRPTLKLLYGWLKEVYNYRNSYDALRRYMRKHFPEFCRKKSWVRIETPPGVLFQVDWKEDLKVQLGEPGYWVRVQAFVLSLCFSRKMIVVYSMGRDLECFIWCHQEGFRKLGGLCEFIRPDCLKSAVQKWRGQKSQLNARYASYMKRLDIEVFPSRPGTATDKGKVEKRIRDFFSNMDFKHRVYKDLLDLQQASDLKLKELESDWRCGATGLSVEESFAYEKKYLKSLPDYFPALPVVEKRLRVRKDATVNFCHNYYQLERFYIGKEVLCINTGHEVVIYHKGVEINRYAYLGHSRGMVMLSQEALRDEKLYLSETVRGWALEVAQRQVSIYHEIAEGGIN